MTKWGERWLANTGKPYKIDMEQFMKDFPAETERCTQELVKAVEFAENNITSDTAQWHIVGPWLQSPGVGQHDHFDWYWTVGGHMGYGEAWASRQGDEFTMKFTWHLTDTFTIVDKWPEQDAWIERGGLACGFLADGEFTRTYKWHKGEFHGRCDPYAK